MGFWNVKRTGSAIDVRLQRAAELEFDVFFLAEVHLDKDKEGNLQVKRYARYERILSLIEGTKIVAYVASELMGSIAVLWEDNNMVVTNRLELLQECRLVDCHPRWELYLKVLTAALGGS